MKHILKHRDYPTEITFSISDKSVFVFVTVDRKITNDFNSSVVITQCGIKSAREQWKAYIREGYYHYNIPKSADAKGEKGQISMDYANGIVYTCIATDTWVRAVGGK